MQYLWIVLYTSRNHNLLVIFSKCEFQFDFITFRGYVELKDGIIVDLKKVEAIHYWSKSTSLSKVYNFIRLVGYYMMFIKSFATIVAPIMRLTLNEVFYVVLYE